MGSELIIIPIIFGEIFEDFIYTFQHETKKG